DDRLGSTRLNFEGSIDDALASRPRRLKDADQLLYGDLLARGSLSPADKLLLKALLGQQQQDGGFPAKVPNTPAGHNTRATPAHFAIQALVEARKLICAGR